LAEIEKVAGEHGVRHLVLVQPSVYGTDNSLIMAALEKEPGRHRAVVVLDTNIGDLDLDAMHAAGVRGARFNLVSPVGEGTTVEQRFDALAPRLKSRGWHLQWYVNAHQLTQVAALHAGSGLTCVLDHLGGMGAGIEMDDARFEPLAKLAHAGAWVKLSGWYRLGASAPYAPLLNTARRVVDMFGPRSVWGSDWPHTSFNPDEMPPYASTWQPVLEALGVEASRELRTRTPAIYL
jgi:predicted TIM-barrel fold metal-dependent hydrolase